VVPLNTHSNPQTKLPRRVACAFLVVVACLCCATVTLAANPTLVVTPTSWTTPTIDSTWLAGGSVGSVAGNAGSDLIGTYQSATNLVNLAINPRRNAGTCTVWRVDASWWTGGTIKVQCAARSTGWVTVGTSATPATFFTYPTGNSVVNYLVQVQLNGIAYSVAAGAYSTTLSFRVQ